MEKRYLKFVKYIFLLLAVFLLFLIFFPRNYDMPQLAKRPGTKFWNLSTGSTIAYYLVPGQGMKQHYPIVFLHGGPGGHIAERDIRTLSQLSIAGFDVYLYDQIGSGKSLRLKNISDYTVDRHISDLRKIIEETKSSKIILIGQSWGAILAVLFAAQYPDLIEKIIFTNPGPVFPIRQNLANIKAPDTLQLKDPFFTNAMGNKNANNIRTRIMAFFARRFTRKLATDKEADEFQTLLEFEVNKSTVCDTSKIPMPEAGGGFYAQVMTFNSLLKIQDVRHKIKNSIIPILVLKGQCDNQEWGFSQEYLELFPNHQLVVIPNAGHAISVEQPEFYLDAIREFVSE